MCYDLYYLYPRCGHLVSINGVEHLCTEFPTTGEICKVGNNEEKYLLGRVAMKWEWLLKSEADLEYVSGREHPRRTREFNTQRWGPGFCENCKKWHSTPLTDEEMQHVTGGELDGWDRHKKWLKEKKAQEWQWEMLKRQSTEGTMSAGDTTSRKKQLSPVMEEEGREKEAKARGGQEEEGRDKGKGKSLEEFTEEAMLEMAIAASLLEQ